MPPDRTGSDLDLLEFLSESEIRGVLRNYAKANRIAAGMVSSPHELHALYRKCLDAPSAFNESSRQKYQSWRITPVTNQDPNCQSTRVPLEGERGCFCSDAQNSEAAHQRGTPVLYRCHTGNIEIVCGVYVGTRHVANIYGGQVRLAPAHDQDLNRNPLLREFLVSASESDSRESGTHTPAAPNPERAPSAMQQAALALQKKTAAREQAVQRKIEENKHLEDEDKDFLGPNIPQEKSPDELFWCILQLKDIAGLLSHVATERAMDIFLQRVEREVSELADVHQGIQAYLRVLRQLSPYRGAVLSYKPRASGPFPRLMVWPDREHLSSLPASALDELERQLAGSESETAFDASPHEPDVQAEAFLKALDCTDGIRSFPLESASRRPGKCYLAYDEPHNGFQEEQAKIVRDMVLPRISAFLEGADEMQLLFETQQKVASMAIHPDQFGLPKAIVEGGRKLYGKGQHVGLWLFNHAAQTFTHLDIDEGDPFHKTTLPFLDSAGRPQCISARAVLDRKPFWVTQESDDWKQLHNLAKTAEAHGFQAVLSVPLIAGTRLVGVLNIHQNTTQPPTQHESGLLGSYGESTAHTLQIWDLNRTATTLDRCESFRDIERFLQSDAYRITGARMGALWLYRADLDLYVFVGAWGTLETAKEGQQAEDKAYHLTYKRPHVQGAVTEKLISEAVYCCDGKNSNLTSFRIRSAFQEYRSWIALPLRSLPDEETPSKPLGALFLNYEQLRKHNPLPPAEAPKWDETEKHYLASFAAYVSGAVGRISRVLLLRCQVTCTRYAPDVANAQYESAAALAQIEDLGRHPDLLNKSVADRLVHCTRVIRKSLFERGEAKTGSSYAGFLDTLELPQLVNDCWDIVQKRWTPNNVKYTYWDGLDAGHAIRLDWPRLYFRHVLEGLIEGVVSLVMESRPSHAHPVEIEIKAYLWDSDVHLTFFSSALRFDEDHRKQINTNQDSPRFSKRIDSLRKADCFLFLAGGRLWVEKADRQAAESGFVIKTIIPRTFHLHREN